MRCTATGLIFPTRPVHIVVPFGPGGSQNLVGRSFNQGLRAALGQPFIVENRPGAGGVTGTLDANHLRLFSDPIL